MQSISRRPAVELKINQSSQPIRKGDMVFMNPKSKAPNTPERAAVVKNFDQKTGKLVLLLGNPLAKNRYDLSDPKDRARIMAFGRPSPKDFK